MNARSIFMMYAAWGVKLKKNGLLYLEICEIIKPDYFVHGSDWRKGPQNKIRIKLINSISKWGGKVKEFKYTKNISSTILKEKYSGSRS